MLGWRTVPTDDATLGATARAAEPVVRQVFIGASADWPPTCDDLAFERKLYVIRRVAEHAIRYPEPGGDEHFYIASLSCRTIVYKGMLTSEQVEEFYPDLPTPRWTRRWPWSIRASAPTPSPVGRARSPSATCSTTARSTRSAATSTG